MELNAGQEGKALSAQMEGLRIYQDAYQASLENPAAEKKEELMNLATNLERSALFFPDRPAISEAGHEMTYVQLNIKANQVATALLKMGVKARRLYWSLRSQLR
jgi:non-ribosomal peptide synthetase component F